VTRVLLEVAIESADDARCARAAGADRFELCAALDVGGLTPTIGTLRAVRAAVDAPIFTMIRPRAGGFCYSDAEIAAMRTDIETTLAHGADGVVFGVLTDDFRVDVARCRALLAATGGRPAVLHRAFDLTPDPFAALDTLIDLGFQRLLTSGQCAAACEERALDLIGRLIDQAAGRIEILPGSGLRAGNVAALVTGARCTQVHGAFRVAEPDRGLNERGVRFGFGVPGKGECRTRTNEAEVRAMRAALDALAAT
jgi:copper homeostasis protein